MLFSLLRNSNDRCCIHLELGNVQSELRTRYRIVHSRFSVVGSGLPGQEPYKKCLRVDK